MNASIIAWLLGLGIHGCPAAPWLFNHVNIVVRFILIDFGNYIRSRLSPGLLKRHTRGDLSSHGYDTGYTRYLCKRNTVDTKVLMASHLELSPSTKAQRFFCLIQGQMRRPQTRPTFKKYHLFTWDPIERHRAMPRGSTPSRNTQDEKTVYP